MSKQEDEDEYKVGYGKPPKQTQFKSGQSGNPRGRPKGRKNVSTILEEALYQKVQISRDGRKKTVTAIEALFLRVVKGGLEGDSRSIASLLKLLSILQATGHRRDGSTSEADESPLDRPIEEVERQVLESFADLLRDGTLTEPKDGGEAK